MRHYAGYTRVYTGFQGCGRAVHVKNNMVGIVEQAMRDCQKNYHLTTIFRQIVGLNADPLQGQGENPAGDARTITSGNVTLKYYMFNGEVLIQMLAIGMSQKAKGVGLFKVEYDTARGRWLSSKDPVEKLNGRSRWKSKDRDAHYAAVAGHFDNRDDAGRHLISHITGAYTKADYLTSSDVKDSYSLFWVEKGQHKKPDTAQKLASVIQHGTQNQLPVNWLVHGEGAHTFKKVAAILKTTEKAQNQRVYFSNPSIDSAKQLETLCSDAGMIYVGLNANQRDLRRWSTLKNVGKELGKAALVGMASSGAASVSASDGLRPLGANSIGKVTNNGIEALLSGNHFAALACVAGAGVIVAGAARKSKTAAAAMSCTFGKGNQRWYVSDAELISA